ncbi:MAG: nucleotidyltransferase domain-containing protein [Acidobacteriia bacterium]|nr:nucleotidyltransferase domain-containing protein [Terriglobia bacterium]
MLAVAPSGAPTRENAALAAEALVSAGVSKVLLFGSVARGDAGLRSDLDLVAVFDDLDYTTRFDVRAELMAAAVQAALCDVDIIVTDRPEWRWRTSRVTSSLEAAIAPDAVTLVDVGTGSVRWGKEIGLAASNKEEALDRLDDAYLHLVSIRRHLRPDDTTDWLGAPVSSSERLTVERVRMRDLCAFAALAIESTVKGFRAAAGGEGRLTHQIWPLIGQTGEHREALVRALAPVRRNSIPDPRGMPGEPRPDYNDVGLMRTAGTYVSEVPGATFERLADLAPRICQAATAAALLAAERLAHDAPHRVAPLKALASQVESYLARHSVVSGELVPYAAGGE